LSRNVRILESPNLTEEVFRVAHLQSAAGIAIVGHDEVGNVHAALRAQDLNPQVRLVIRMSNMRLGSRIRTLFNDCVVLSDAYMAAPPFVAAALGEHGPSHVRVGGRTLMTADRVAVEPSRVVCGVADTRGSPDRPRLLPADGEEADQVLAVADGSAHPPPDARNRKRLPSWKIVRASADRRLVAATATMVGLLILGTVAFAYTDGSGGWPHAIYLTLLDVAGAANPDDTHGTVYHLVQVIVTLLGIALIPAITATIVDAVVRARLAGAEAGPRQPIGGHVVVAGLGEVGSRVLAQLRDLGLGVVGADRDPDAPGVRLARRLGVPVILGDVTREETLRSASVGTCRALVVLTSDDIANLEAGLNGRALREDLRVVLRLFDDDLAARVHRNFHIDVSRSVSYLAAPTFTAAVMSRQVIATMPFGRRVMLIAEVTVDEDCELAGRTLLEAHRDGEARVIALVDGTRRYDWEIGEDRVLSPGDHLVVLATRGGLGGLLRRCAAPEAMP
jgi:Trk K+ transport system NAD-binding subunit